MIQNVNYDAFISFSHDPDSPIAAAIRAGLHRFARPMFALRSLRIFVDDASMVPGELNSALRTALDESHFLILLASPAAAKSKHVRYEISHWLELGRKNSLLLVLTDGNLEWDPSADDFATSSNAIPPELFGIFKEQPLYLDLRGNRSVAPDNVILASVIAKLYARINDVSLDEAYGQDVTEQRRLGRRKNAALATLAALTVLAVVAAVVALHMREVALLRADAARALALRESAPIKALEIASQAVDLTIKRDIELPELHNSLRSTLDASRQLAVLPGPFNAHAAYGLAVALAVSNSGESIAISNSDLVFLIDANGRPVGEPIAAPDGGHLLANALAWNPSGTALAVASGERLSEGTKQAAVRIYSREGKLMTELATGSEAPFTAVTFDRFGRSVYAADDAGSVLLWADGARAEGQEVLSVTDQAINGLAVSRYGVVHAAAAPRPRTMLGLIRSGESQRSTKPGDSSIPISIVPDLLTSGTLCIDLSVAQDLLLTCGANGLAILWNVDHDGSLERRVVLRGHVGRVLGGAISPDGRLIATAGDDATVRVWTRNGTLAVDPLRGHSGSVRGVGFLDEGRQLISASADGSLRRWDLHDIANNFDSITAQSPRIFAANPDCGFAYASYNSVRFVKPGADEFRINIPNADAVNALGINKDCSSIAIGLNGEHAGSTLFHFDTESNELNSVAQITEPISALTYAVDGDTLAVAISPMPGVAQLVKAMVELSLDAGLADLDLPEVDISMRFIDSRFGVLQQFDDAHQNEIQQVAAGPLTGMAAFASASSDGVVRLWSAEGTPIGDGIQLPVSRGPLGVAVTAMAFEPNGRHLAVATSAGADVSFDQLDVVVHIVELSSVPRTVESWPGFGKAITAMAFDSDGEVLIAGEGSEFHEDGSDHALRLWWIDGTALEGAHFHLSSVLAVWFGTSMQDIHTVDSRGDYYTWPVGITALQEIARSRLAQVLAGRIAESHANAADESLRRSDPDAALCHMTVAIGAQPQNDDLYRKRANLLWSGGHNKEALADYDRVVDLQPYNPLGYFVRGKQLFKMRMYDQAESDFLSALRLANYFPRPAVPAADFIDINRQLAQAMWSTHKAMPTELYEWLGITQWWLGNAAAAEESLTKAIELGRENEKTLGWRATAKGYLGKRKEALADIERLISLQPENGWAYGRRAELRSQGGEADAAMGEDCAMARRLPSENGDIPSVCEP